MTVLRIDQVSLEVPNSWRPFPFGRSDDGSFSAQRFRLLFHSAGKLLVERAVVLDRAPKGRDSPFSRLRVDEQFDASVACGIKANGESRRFGSDPREDLWLTW